MRYTQSFCCIAKTFFAFFLVYILIFAQSASAQELSIFDADTKEPLRSATLTSQDPFLATITNDKGITEISAFEGVGLIEIRRLGYKTKFLSYDDLKQLDFRLGMQSTSFNMEDLVVSATRYEQLTSHVPAKVAIISPQEFEQLNPQTSADLLGISGKVFIQKSQQGGGSPMIRGFATNRLLYTVDGVRMNTAIFRGGNIQNVISLDPFAMESTEILFGPGSVIYGSDAIGGVMAFQTLSPSYSVNGEITTSGQVAARMATANNEQTIHAHVKVGWEKWAMVTSLSSFDYGHLRQGRHGPDDYIKSYFVQRQDGVDRIVDQDDELLQIPTAYHQNNLMQKVRYRVSEALDLEYGFHYSETTDYGRYDRHNRVRNGLPRHAEWRYGPQKWMMNLLKAVHKPTDSPIYDELQFRAAWQRFQESRIDRSFNRPTRSIREEEVDAYSINLDFKKSTSETHTLFYGFEYVSNDVTSKGTDQDIVADTRQAGPSRYPQSAWQSIAVYLTDEYELSEDLTAQLGLRYNRYILDAEFDNRFYPFPFSQANLNEDALVGNVGATYRIDKDWVFRANLSTAFRSPNVDDIGKIFDSEPGAVVIPNPELQAEEAVSLDLGMVRQFGERARIDFSAYYTWLDNALVRRDFSLNGQDSIMYDGVLSRVQAIQNAAEARVFGIQLGVDWQLSKEFRFAADVNWQEGEEELDDGSTSASRHAAPLFGVAHLHYEEGRLSMQVFTQFQGERAHSNLSVEERPKDEIYALDANGNTFAPAWYTLNFSMRYILNETFSISAGMENITDRRYRPYSSGISGAGRNVNLAVRARF